MRVPQSSTGWEWLNHPSGAQEISCHRSGWLEAMHSYAFAWFEQVLLHLGPLKADSMKPCCENAHGFLAMSELDCDLESKKGSGFRTWT